LVTRYFSYHTQKKAFMTTYDQNTVDKAFDHFITLEWESFNEQKILEMIEKWESDGGLMEILYEKGYTDDSAISVAENMDSDEIHEYFFFYYWFPKRKRELRKIWIEGVVKED